MGIFEGDAAGDRIKYTADVPMAAAKGIRSAVAMVGRRKPVAATAAAAAAAEAAAAEAKARTART
jgi:hypothetical protein